MNHAISPGAALPAPPTVVPLSPPVTLPVSPPVMLPVSAPVMLPVSPPVILPVSAPVTLAVSAPLVSPRSPHTRSQNPHPPNSTTMLVNSSALRAFTKLMRQVSVSGLDRLDVLQNSRPVSLVVSRELQSKSFCNREALEAYVVDSRHRGNQGLQRLRGPSPVISLHGQISDVAKSVSINQAP